MKLKIVVSATAVLLAAGTTVLLTTETRPPPEASVAFSTPGVLAPPWPTPSTSAPTSTIASPTPRGSTAPPTPTPTTTAPTKTTKPLALNAAVSALNASGPITFYAAADNDPAGSREIAFPGLHREAGGTGTFADPLTFAAAKGVFEPGTKVYVPDVQRYFVLEDSCASCSGSHIDLWTGPAVDDGVIRCEESLTRDGTRPYQVNPPAGLPVTPGDLYRGGKCYQA
jgi:3D (Asp-Asp-Asp) domain-containing protein